MQKLVGVVQNYAWGDPNFIADLIGVDRTQPQAEYWLGAHPRGAGTLTDGAKLNEVIATDPTSELGFDVHERYGQLPYLLKILAAGRPLSIQCHPSKHQAEAGFERENEAGVALGSAERTYRDDNHKPELICAITPFEAKVGFRSVPETIVLFSLLKSPELGDLKGLLAEPDVESAVIRNVLSYLLELPKAQALHLVAAVVESAHEALQHGAGNFRKVLEWTPTIEQHFPGDVGVIVALLLNHISLEPNQAIGLKAGNMHCYLSGVGVELMANSDNVVRGGMTLKHVDIVELLKVVDSEPAIPVIESPTSDVYTYPSPADEFSLTRILGADTKIFEVTGPEIWVVTSGRFSLSSGGFKLDLLEGDACFVSARDDHLEVSGSGKGWRAEVGR